MAGVSPSVVLSMKETLLTAQSQEHFQWKRKSKMIYKVNKNNRSTIIGGSTQEYFLLKKKKKVLCLLYFFF